MLIKDLYKIQQFEVNEQKVAAELFINKDNEIFKGHFPNNPVMPGVCMIQIIKELTEKASKKKMLMQNASNIKFMALINPNLNPTLNLTIDFSENDGIIKVKSITKFEETTALKYNGVFKIIS